MSAAQIRSEQRRSANLYWAWRLALVVGGVVGVIGGLWLFIDPPQRTTTVSQAKDLPTTTVSQPEPTVFAITVFITGAALIVIAANGRKISRLSKEGADFEAPSESQVEADVKTAKTIRIGKMPEPIPLVSPGKTFKRSGFKYQVFDPEGVPLKVLTAASEGAPDSVQAITDIDYAFRRTGQGDHTWFLKPASGDALAVSFGEQGKGGDITAADIDI